MCARVLNSATYYAYSAFFVRALFLGLLERRNVFEIHNEASERNTGGRPWSEFCKP